MGPHKGPKGTLSKPKGPGPRKRATNQNDARQIQSIEPNGPPQGSHNGPTKVPQIKKPKSRWQQDFQGLGLVLSNLTNVSMQSSITLANGLLEVRGSESRGLMYSAFQW